MRTSRLWRKLGSLALLGVLLLGCNSGQHSFPTAKLTGKVTLNGQSVAEGDMQFVPEGSGQAVSAKIQAGQYTAAGVCKGKNRVTFSILENTGELDTSRDPPLPIFKNVVPPQYAEGVVVEVTGDAAQNFDLVSTGS